MMSEEQAQAGLEYLRQLQGQGNYWGAMAMPPIEKRLQAGEEPTAIMSGVLDDAARWLGLGAGPGGENRATEFGGANRQSLRDLFDVTGQKPRDYGYHRVA